MTCEHLQPLDLELLKNQVPVTFRGQAWSENCREWVYFQCTFPDLESTIERLGLDPSIIKIHSHIGTHDGREHGLICTLCNDGIMGVHPSDADTHFPSIV